MNISLIIMGSILLIGIIVISVIRISNNKRLKVVMNSSTKSVDEFVEIETFDEDKYIKDTFGLVFHSIRIEDWERSIDFEEIRFRKSPKKNSYAHDEVKLIVKYKIKSGLFKIDTILLSSGGTYTHKGNLDIDDYKFFYDIYVEYKTTFNNEKKDRVDKSLKKIHNIVGKASIRDSKIDDILNNK